MKLLKRMCGWIKQITKRFADPYNRNYVCRVSDPINTIKDLRVGNWNMNNVKESFDEGIIRFARQSEVDKAIANGLISERTREPT